MGKSPLDSRLLSKCSTAYKIQIGKTDRKNCRKKQDLEPEFLIFETIDENEGQGQHAIVAKQIQEQSGTSPGTRSTLRPGHR